MRKFLIVSAVGLLSLAWAMPGFAQLVPVETDTETTGATTVQWNSAFLVENYDCMPLTVTMDDLAITATEGAVAFVTFLEKKKEITPVSTGKKPKAEGDVIASDTVMINFLRLHGGENNSFKGTAHFLWQGMVDEDGEEGLEATAKYGVNVHVVRPGEQGNCPTP